MQEPSRIHVAIVSGGYSGEREISLNSADVVLDNLDQDQYDCHIIIIDRDAWYVKTAGGEEFQINKSDFSIELPSGKLIFDVVFIALHGIPGEDGKMQGYFDMLGIPYTSCDAITSALTFDKYFTKQVAQSAGILTAASKVLAKNDRIDTEAILGITGLPCFVKPNCGGSSVGMTKVNNADELIKAIDLARQEDERVIIEQFVGGRELTCGVLELKGNLHVLPLTEIVSMKEFFDYEAKYTAGMADEITPADITVDIERDIKTLSSLLYKEFNCHGIVRFDYIVNDDGAWFLELNTIPGLSAASIVPQQVEFFGWNLNYFFTSLIEDALWRNRS